ncbi:MAG: DNA polymerase/3'-5' exonuclease PolX [Planctomycetota bacterium]|jgi:DNA polymerase (family 10)
MSVNAELSRIFGEMAAVLELTGANPFRVNAHLRVARVLKDLTVDVGPLADAADRLTAIEGIGEGSAKKIIEYVRTGRIGELDKLLATIPRGLLEVMEIPGLGPKTVKLLWEKAGVTDVESLKEKLDSGDLEKLPRLGAKTVENIRESIAFMSAAGGRIRLGEALPRAEQIIESLRAVDRTTRVEHAGSLRRGRETIGDIDILACTSDPQALGRAFRSMPGVVKVLAAGETKSSVRLEAGMQVDLRVVDQESFGAALMYFTGSKQHNVLMRERAIRKNLRLNEYGLFPGRDNEARTPQSRGVKPVASKEEHELFAALDLPWLPPEIREGRGELELRSTPRLIEGRDIKAELHAHTVASDGRMTIDELAEAALARGFHTVAVTDHSRSSAQANGLSPDRLRDHIEDVREADQRIDRITILAGSEVDILADGRLDYEDDLLAKLDLVIASPHSALRQDEPAATKRLLEAIRHPLVHIVGHPTGRLINRREGLHPQVEALVEAAAETETALEINANYLRLDLRDVHVRAAVEAGALLSINTDAHAPDQLDFLRYGILTARRGWLTADRCVNTWSRQKLRGWLAKKGTERLSD